jgi:adenine phosphoribosyltransferase
VNLEEKIRSFPDFPKKGILFRDISPVLHDPEALKEAIRLMGRGLERPEAVVAIESRGFVFGTGLALHWNVPLVPARKFGKLPGPTVRQVYSLEYGEDSLEIQAGSLGVGTRVAIVDDLLATGGTAKATAGLVEKLDARVTALVFLVELRGLGGREALAGWPVHSVLQL